MKHLPNRMTIGTFFLCALIFAIMLFAVRYATRIAGQAEQMYQHPYTVKSAAQSMRTRLMEMRLYLLPTMLEASGQGQLKDIYQMLDRRDAVQDASLAIIKKDYLGNPADVSELEAALAAVRQARRQAVPFCVGTSDEGRIITYLKEHVYPASETVDAVLQRIINFADTRVQKFREDIEGMKNAMIRGAVLLGLLFTGMLSFIYISEQHKNRHLASREHLLSLLSQSIDDVFFVVAEGRLEFVSENCHRLLGIRPEEFYQDDWAIWAMERGLTPTAAVEFHTLLTGAVDDKVEKNLRYQRDGKIQDLRLHAYPVVIKNEARRVIVVLSDLTRVAAQQDALNNALLAAQKANRAKQEFLSRMSHDLRVSINVITGVVGVAAKSLGDRERMKDYLAKIAVSAKYLSRLVNDVLEISKVDKGEFVFARGTFSLRDTLTRLADIIYPQTVDKGQKFEISISGFSAEILIGDELRLHQVLVNLLSNAVRFTPQGGEIRLEITCLQHENSRALLLRFVVRDTGIGMSKKSLTRLHAPFKQAGSAALQNYDGAGLGLIITKNLVSTMLGSISVASEEGRGTAVTLQLPFGLPEQEKRPLSSGLGSLSVLVADGDPVAGEHAVRLLEEIGAHGDWVDSGEKAVEKAIRAREEGRGYAVCFIDWSMPGIGGAESVRRLRAQMGADTRIIISSYDGRRILQEALDAGADTFISKPFFASALCEALGDFRQPGIAATEPGIAATEPGIAATEPGIAATEPGIAATGLYDEFYRFKGKKILLAEDNSRNQKNIPEFLQSLGLGVDRANDGPQALHMYQSSTAGEYALILMDVDLPHMSGFEVARSIRAANHPDAKTVPVLAILAKTSSSEARMVQEAGMDGYIPKPVDMLTLSISVAAHLARVETYATHLLRS